MPAGLSAEMTSAGRLESLCRETIGHDRKDDEVTVMIHEMAFIKDAEYDPLNLTLNVFNTDHFPAFCFKMTVNVATVTEDRSLTSNPVCPHLFD